MTKTLTKTEYEAEIKKRIAAQDELCRRENAPHFAPSNGVCHACRKQIYEVFDGTSHVTGCPHCCQSYCD